MFVLLILFLWNSPLHKSNFLNKSCSLLVHTVLAICYPYYLTFFNSLIDYISLECYLCWNCSYFWVCICLKGKRNSIFNLSQKMLDAAQICRIILRLKQFFSCWTCLNGVKDNIEKWLILVFALKGWKCLNRVEHEVKIFRLKSSLVCKIF